MPVQGIIGAGAGIITRRSPSIQVVGNLSAGELRNVAEGIIASGGAQAKTGAEALGTATSSGIILLDRAAYGFEDFNLPRFSK